MELIWTAFLLGLVGSLHCAGMCGPLALALPSGGTTRVSFVTGRLLYNAGRIATYTALGLLFGLVGRSLALAGMQRWLSVFAGVAILAGLFLSTRFATGAPVAKLVVLLKSVFAGLLRRRSLVSLFALGLINGLLPCGLVYVAAAGAAATGDLATGALHMAAFGAGTLPVMLGIGLVGRRLQVAVQFRKWIPFSVALVAALLLLRGMGLGIPYLSPDLASVGAHACH